MRFIVASYGSKHVGMLLAHLHSIACSHPAAHVSVYWQDIPAPLIETLQAAFSDHRFVKTGFELDRDPVQRISSKVNAWCQAVEDHPEDPHLCLADVDTLVIKDIQGFFTGQADIVFTDKPEPIVLNTGVLLARSGPKARAFFRLWRERTVEILRTPELYRQANDFSLQYGAADQMALHRMIGYQPDRAAYECMAEGLRVNVRAEPCASLNQTNSLPITDGMHILHYKGGWQPILLEGRLFSRNRPRERSWEMFTFYIRCFDEGLSTVNAAAGTRWTARDFGVVIPPYYNVATGGFDGAWYTLWKLRAAGISTAQDFRRAAKKLGGIISKS